MQHKPKAAHLDRVNVHKRTSDDTFLHIKWCCIHSQWNRRRGLASALTQPSHFTVLLILLSPSYDDGLSLMQIYNHFICCRLLPAGCWSIAQHDLTSKMSASKQPVSSASSQSPSFTCTAGWRLMHLLASAAADPQYCLYVETMHRAASAPHLPGTMPLLSSDLSLVTAMQHVLKICVPQHCCISPLWMVGHKTKCKKKGDSFSPYQLGKAMLWPCNWGGISSINSATLDNKYRVHSSSSEI